MKKLMCLFIVFTIATCSLAQDIKPAWNATVRVLDESNQPIAGCTVEMWFYVTPNQGETEAHEHVEGYTDTNGIVRLSHLNTGSIDLGFRATKVGYYETKEGHEFYAFKENNPQKWNPTVTLVLKKIGRPIPMYAKSITYIKFPVFNKPIGYDFTVGDWVAPYGKGVTTDFLFAENLTNTQLGYALTICSPNQGDGIQGFTRKWDSGVSGLISSNKAPNDGYESQYIQTQMPNPNRIYYFRVRTTLDGQGNILSTHYGKIYGDFMQFRYYLNPTPNDQNVEFDPKHNLLGGLKSFEEVTAP